MECLLYIEVMQAYPYVNRFKKAILRMMISTFFFFFFTQQAFCHLNLQTEHNTMPHANNHE